MKVDFRLVVGNPPYLDGMWQRHLEMMINRSNRYIISINPDPSDRTSKIGSYFKEQMIRNGIQYRVECTGDFPTINSGKISGFILDKKLKSNQKVFESEEEIIKNFFFDRANRYSKREVIKGKGFKEFRERHVSEIKTENHFIPFIRGLKQSGIVLMFSDIHDSAYHFVGDWFLINRDFGNKFDDPIAYISEMEGIFPSGNILIIKANRGESIDFFRSLYCSKPYLFLFKLIKQGMRDIQASQFRNFIPHLDITRSWTDKEIYKEIGLSQNQIEFIENSMSNKELNLSKEEYRDLHSGKIDRNQERIDNTGEVFTPSYRVGSLLDKVDKEIWSDRDADILEPAVGEGAFIIEILKRKLANGLSEVEALRSLYGIDIMEDNIHITRANLLSLVSNTTENKKIIETNIILGDALDNQIWRKLKNWNNPTDNTESLLDFT